MKFSAAALSATLVALASGVAAQLAVLSPGGSNLWMIAESDNVITWTCKTSPYPNFAIWILNLDVTVLAAAQILVSVQTNFDCSKLITKDLMNLKPASGYFIQLTDQLNNTNVFAQSQPFDIKPFGAAYPASSATPTAVTTTVPISAVPAVSRSSTSASSSTRSSTSATPTSTGTTQGQNGAAGLFAPAGIAAAAFAALGVVFG